MSLQKVYELYEGSAALEFHKKGKSHWYEVGGDKIPGVTDVTGIVSKAEPLMVWATGCMRDYLEENLKPGVALDEVQLTEMLDTARWAYRQVSNRALAIGSSVHEWIERHIKLKLMGNPKGNRGNMPINSQVKMGAEAYLDWEAENKVEYIATERKVLSMEYGYAGTLDIEAKINGELGINDVKTSKGIYDEMKMQLAAYRNGRQEETGQEYPACHIIRVPKEGGDIEVVRLEDYETAFEGFLGCLVAYRALSKLKGGKKP